MSEQYEAINEEQEQSVEEQENFKEESEFIYGVWTKKGKQLCYSCYREEEGYEYPIEKDPAVIDVWSETSIQYESFTNDLESFYCDNCGTAIYDSGMDDLPED